LTACVIISMYISKKEHNHGGFLQRGMAFNNLILMRKHRGILLWTALEPMEFKYLILKGVLIVKKSILVLLICVSLLFVQFNMFEDTVDAQGQVVVEAAFNEQMVMHLDGGKPFIAALGSFALNYGIYNGLSVEIEEWQLIESLSPIGEGEHLNKNIVYEPISAGYAKTLSGQPFSGINEEDSPHTVYYRFRYRLAGEVDFHEIYGQETVYVANTQLSVTYRTDYTEPVFLGHDVKLIAEVESLANVTLYNIFVSDSTYGEIGVIDVLPPGGYKKVEKVFPARKSEINYPILSFNHPVIVEKNIKQEYFEKQVVIDVIAEESVASIQVTGTPDKGYLPSESGVEFFLTVKNTGNTPLVEILTSDWNGETIFTHDRLMPDEEVEFTYIAEIEPDIPYEILTTAVAEGSSQKIKSVYAVQIKRYDAKVEIERSYGTEPIKEGEKFTIDYKIKNTGNIDLADIKIEEPFFGEIKRISLLKAGEEAAFSHEFTAKAEMVSNTILNAVDTEMGKGYTCEAGEVKIPVEAAQGTGDQEEKPAALSVVLETDKTTLAKPGTVELFCTVANTGGKPLYSLEVKLMDRETHVENISRLKPGEQQRVNILPMRLEKTETFKILVSGLDGDGNAVTYESSPITIEVGGGATGGTASILRTALVVIVLLIILTAGSLIYLLRGSIRLPVRRRRKSGRSLPKMK
jgi:hypothetical protein